LSLEERSERLDMAILSGGREAAVESRSPTQAVLLTSRGMSGAAHVVFALLSIFTCGLFLIPWAIMAATQHDQRAVVTVDLYGNVTWSF
jgi:hypothetical protein